MDTPLYLKTAAVLFFVDLFWLGTAGIFGRAMFERIQGEPLSFRFMSGALVYLFLASLLLDTMTYREAFLRGVAVYGVYEFTNHAVFERYDWKFAVADTLWGGVLFVCARYLLKNVF